MMEMFLQTLLRRQQTNYEIFYLDSQYNFNTEKAYKMTEENEKISMAENIKDRSRSSKIQGKTETITFRLPTYLIEELRNDSELEEVSLNSFVTRIFSNHIKWERYERRAGLLPMTRPFLKEVLNQMTETQVNSLAYKIEKDSFKSILGFLNENIELEDFIKFLRTWLTASWMQHNIEIKNGSYYRFNIQHDLGIKWSLYVKTLVSELCQDVLNTKVDVKIDDNLISLVFREYP
jgi:hypothetical protein